MSVVLLHGSFGNTAENWIPSTADALRSHDVVVVTPSLPTPQFQTYAAWSLILQAYVDAGAIDGSSIIVAHSSSAPFVVRFIASKRLRIRGLVTVSGFTDFTSGNDAFDQINREVDIQDVSDFATVRGLVERRYSFYSNNDPFLPAEKLQNFAAMLESQEMIVPDGGHFNSDAGYGHFDLLVSLLAKEVLGKSIN